MVLRIRRCMKIIFPPPPPLGCLYVIFSRSLRASGLGAPVGSAVVGSADFISRAMRVRKALGGGMRQSGVVAAAALEGLRKQLPRIGEDHTNAGRLAQVGVAGGGVVHLSFFLGLFSFSFFSLFLRCYVEVFLCS